MKVNDFSESAEKYGLYYSLPQTMINLNVTITESEDIKGPYSEFASKYLGLTNVITSNALSYEISSMELSSTAFPDPTQIYFVELPEKYKKGTREMFISLSQAGLITGTDTADISDASARQIYTAMEETNIYPDIFKYYADMNIFEKIDTIFEKMNFDTVTVEKMTLKRSMVEKTLEQKASDAADFIIKIKENRFNLISGFQEVNYDKETFRYMNEELEKMENEYRKLFTGLTFTKEISFTFSYFPRPGAQADSVPLFRFSKLKGIMDTSALYGDLICLKIVPARTVAAVEPFIIAKQDKKEKETHGFYYRVPEYADIKLYSADIEKLSGTLPVAQYGYIDNLPPLMFRISFDPLTGGIRFVGLD